MFIDVCSLQETDDNWFKFLLRDKTYQEKKSRNHIQTKISIEGSYRRQKCKRNQFGPLDCISETKRSNSRPLQDDSQSSSCEFGNRGVDSVESEDSRIVHNKITMNLSRLNLKGESSRGKEGYLGKPSCWKHLVTKKSMQKRHKIKNRRLKLGSKGGDCYPKLYDTSLVESK
ncbi:hypothetical protein L1987_60830 [Smallanthus sonchifolius]|uniref:Uncharacterized protein n=1 Tax=Smallanthus sonchifolius TaxID=185202 RepID=A0ACB9DA09_9ASTR|nr:hypothetical protein L1987_60830 [Smallanthus sonchifolius]